MNFRSVRGTLDRLPKQLQKRRAIERKFEEIFKLHGYGECETPIMEKSSLFKRSLGDSSDVVNKEMFKVNNYNKEEEQDEEEKETILRPEGTTSVMRMILNNNHSASSPPELLYYKGPMFRYERPQKGRFREFNQIGLECIGKCGALSDAECIKIADDCLAAAASTTSPLSDLKNIKLNINTLGTIEERKHYSKTLEAYFSSFPSSALSVDSQQRVREKRFLRILDSKSEIDMEIIEQAPKLMDSLTAFSLKRFDQVLTLLSTYKLQCEIAINHKLVRGLDYYSHTCFEFVSSEKESEKRTARQLTVLAGGRYDTLAKSLGHKASIPCFGWAAGLERLMDCFVNEQVEVMELGNVLIIPLDDSPRVLEKCVRLQCQLLSRKSASIASVQLFDVGEEEGGKKKSFSFKRDLKIIQALNISMTLFIGEEEVNGAFVSVRNNKTLEKVKLMDDELMSFFYSK